MVEEKYQKVTKREQHYFQRLRESRVGSSALPSHLYHLPQLAVGIDVGGHDAAPEGHVHVTLAPRRRQLVAQVGHRRRWRNRVELVYEGGKNCHLIISVQSPVHCGLSTQSGCFVRGTESHKIFPKFLTVAATSIHSAIYRWFAPQSPVKILGQGEREQLG